ncbi:DUF1430 domain-containing protein [Clostridium sp. LY3-2]|uniref:DUF1430 domain-containing protein n=1 Tax=Clostridium sp. LY3-2 TaxID=2942482 RepID=UPI002152B5AD|nr:DUF1430 domain-containing protein [Clostridium sp. LY3-2]MCR6513885.1 DUF1430 domain-containing protein [Clostridium sp. LY3-2]
MKKLIKLLIIIISVLSFFIYLKEFESDEIFNIKNIENNLENSYDIMIPANLAELDREKQYEAFEKISKKTNSSIFFTRVDRDDDKEKIIKYTYLNDDRYMEKIDLDSGVKLNKDSMNKDQILSTENSKYEKQLGIIKVLSDDDILQIKPLKIMLKDGMSFTGFVTISFENNKDIDKKIKDICNIFDVEDLSYSKSETIGKKDSISFFYLGVLYFLIIIILIYNIINSYREFGIKKLLGYSDLDIWREELKSIVLVQVISNIATIIVLSKIFINRFNGSYIIFLKNMIFIYLIMLIITIIFVSIPYLYLKKIKINLVIKNMRNTKEILYFNTVIKIVLILGFTFIISNQLEKLNEVKKIYNGKYNSWEEANDYVTFNLDSLDPTVFDSEEFKEGQDKLYKKLNKEGAIYAEFSIFNDLNSSLNKDSKYYSKACYINPNYLNKHKIYDEFNNEIVVSERNKNWVILIPTQYKKDIKEIKEYFNNWKSTYRDNNKIEIIWTKPSQEYFSYNINVSTEGNKVLDPVMFVGTEDGLFKGWNHYIFNADGNPLKAKVDKDKPLHKQFKDIIKSSGIDSSSLRVNYANEEVQFKINEYKNYFKNLVLGLISGVIIIFVIIIQSINNYFNQNKKLISVRSFHGYSNLEKFKEYFYFILKTYGFIALFMLIIRVNLKVGLTILITGITLEILIALVLLIIINKRHLLKVLKGDW